MRRSSLLILLSIIRQTAAQSSARARRPTLSVDPPGGETANDVPST